MILPFGFTSVRDSKGRSLTKIKYPVSGKYVITFVTVHGCQCFLNQQAVELVFNFPKGEYKMKITMPKTISGWCMWLFFLVVGLGIIPAIGGLIPAFVAPLLALGYAVLSVLGM